MQTERLVLDELTFNDAEFIVELLNDEAFLRFIGDKGVRTVEDARRYLLEGPMKSYRENGFGLLAVRRVEDGATIGMCGLVRRDMLDHPDIGFAFLPDYRANGFAFEAARAVLAHAWSNLGITRLLGICDPDNAGSIRLLEKAGFVFERQIRLAADADPVSLYASEAPGELT